MKTQHFLLVASLTCALPGVAQVSTPAKERPLRELYTSEFPMDVAGWEADWEARRAQVKHRILLAAGLWPLPEKTPLNAVKQSFATLEEHPVVLSMLNKYQGPKGKEAYGYYAP